MASMQKKQKDNPSKKTCDPTLNELKKDNVESCEIEDPQFPVDAVVQFKAREKRVSYLTNKTIREIKTKIKKVVFGFDGVRRQSLNDTEKGISNAVVGIGLSSSHDAAETIDARDVSDVHIIVYLSRYVNEDNFRKFLGDAVNVEDTAKDALQIDLKYCGLIDARDIQHRLSPAPCGSSVSHANSDRVGTIGCLVRGVDAVRSKRILLLSNNHVIGLCNNAKEGDKIVSEYDPNNVLALFDRYKHIDFDGGENFVDAATAWCWKDKVRPELISLLPHGDEYLPLSCISIEPQLGMKVSKCGRTTNRTYGKITAMEVDIRVEYGPGRSAYFTDQLAIEGDGTTFSCNGDSGSLIFSDDDMRNPIGLLFAGTPNFSFANRISHVLSSLDVRLYARDECT